MKKIFLILLGLFFISSVYAAGCCFDRSVGTCSKNTDRDSCSNGDFYDDATCNSVSDCNAGCCILGNNVEFITPPSCYFKAQSMGIIENFQAISEDKCTKLQSKQKEGACIVTGRYSDKTCKYTVQASCTVGQFFEGILCSDASIKNKFNVTCIKTKNTMCYSEDAYFIDSCGNPDIKKQDCDYDKGTICSMNKSSATCKSLDCVDDKGVNRKNGESWCYYDSAKLDYFGIDGSTRDEKYGASEKFENWVEEKVGSRFYRKYCLNGNVEVESCSDMRNEVCDVGKCVKNPWQDCLLAGNETKDCDPKWCSIFVGHPGCGIIRVGETLAGYNNGAPATVDTPFCKGHDNKIITNTATLKTDWGFTDQTISEFRPKIREEAIEFAGMATCFPQYAGGFIYEKQIGDTSDSTMCSAGNVQEVEAVFVRSKYPAEDGGDKHSKQLVIGHFDNKSWGLAGAFNMNPDFWFTLEKTGFAGLVLHLDTESYYMYETKKDLEPWFVESMERRCHYTSDCTGQINILGAGSSGANIISDPAPGVSGSGYDERTTMTNKISLQCMPYEAPREGKCEECQEDEKYPCTEYKCLSTGQSCEYIDSLGVDKSYCMKSSDLSAPKILSHTQAPKSPIKPFSSVQFNLTTDEDSSCKFSLGSGGSKFEDMPNSFGNDWGKNHSLTLNIPGKVKENLTDDEIQYDFLSRDGIYNMYVRCSDPKGNWNLEPYLIKFEVMQTPDSVPPAIMYLNPKSGSPIQFNTTTKLIKFKINEPAQCRWALSDANFSDMNNSFDCDESVYNRGVLKGYDCSGTLKNISANLTKSTTFYIRCKDQPWLEGNETQFYKRNVNEKSVVYSLKNSAKLEIIEVAPKGSLTLGPSVSNFSLNVRTSGGGENGKAQCKWKLGYGNSFFSWQLFSITNSTTHKQVLTNKTAGDYNIYTECTDIAGNKVNSSDNLILRVDTESPTIGRIFNNKGSLEVYTSESSVCKFTSSNDLSGCSFSMLSANLTLMNSKDMLKHSATWTKGKTYYIKCQDLYGNANSVCNVIGKAV
jgi:hypothetical protein